MSIWQSILEALESLTVNKLRSGLTVLGIVIGVGAVIAMMSIGSGAEATITGQIENLGTNLLYIQSGGDARIPESLTLADAAAMSDSDLAPSVVQVAPILQGRVSISQSGTTANPSIIGVTEPYFDLQDVPLAEGSYITFEHNEGRATVVMIGAEVAEELFDRTTNLIGESVRIQGQPYKVIAVLEEQGGTAFGSSDNQIIVPLSTAQLRILRRESNDVVDQIYVQAASADQVASATEEVSQILRSRHRSTLGVDDFNIMSTNQFVETAETITGTLTVFLGGIAGISLLVGGIGIMNIMLVTVMERTKEIGLRKAVGARKFDILIQFLIESSLLSLGGGIIGILVGWGIGSLVGHIALIGGTALEPVIELQAVLMATVFSAAVGLFFGLYPANRAARLEPVEALRIE